MENNVISVVLVAIRKNEKILLLKRKKEPLKGYWSLVGGKLHAGESIDECAVRETKEETGIESEFVSIKAVLHERLFLEEKKVKYGMVFFLAEVFPKTDTLVESDEGEIRWFDIDSLENEKVILSDIWMIKNLLDKKTIVHNIIMQEEKNELKALRVEEYGNHNKDAKKK